MDPYFSALQVGPSLMSELIRVLGRSKTSEALSLNLGRSSVVFQGLRCYLFRKVLNRDFN